MKIQESVLNELGYYKFSLFTPRDLLLVTECIFQKISIALGFTVEKNNLNNLPEAEFLKIQRNKDIRLFNDSEVTMILASESMRRFMNSNSNLTLVKATHPLYGQLEQPELYFRLVPPQAGGAVSLAHFDWWYDEIHSIPKSERPKYKLWVSVMTEPGLNGLLLKKVVPTEYDYQTDYTDVGGLRPNINQEIPETFFDFPSVLPGEALIFDTASVLHLGAKNRGSEPRISIEISLR